MACFKPQDALDISGGMKYICSMPSEIKTNRNSAYSCRYHVVFCPKYRRKVLVPPIDGRLKPILLETIEKWGQEFIEMEVMLDHVHLLVGCDPQFGIHRLVRDIQGTTFRFVRPEFLLFKMKMPRFLMD